MATIDERNEVIRQALIAYAENLVDDAYESEDADVMDAAHRVVENLDVRVETINESILLSTASELAELERRRND